MKKFWEALKDILYDSTDYFIMIAIVGIVVFIIGWRLDLLFADNLTDSKPVNNIIAEKEEPSDHEPEKEKPDKGKAEATIPKVEVHIPKEKTNTPKKEDVTASNQNQTIKIVIPAGSLPSSIGSILESNGLVSSKADFVQKSQDMKLDTKLKSGNYEIKTNTPLEDIVTLLTK